MKSKSENIRLFIGIPFPSSHIDQVKSFITANKQLTQVRWTAFDNLHVTLFFIGSVPKQELHNIINILSEVSVDSQPFQLHFESYQLTPSKKARMIWAKYSSSDNFNQLVNRISKPLEHLRKPDHPPTPHITLARSKKYVSDTPINSSDPLPDLTVNEIVLWESRTHASGVEYIPLNRFRLSI